MLSLESLSGPSEAVQRVKPLQASNCQIESRQTRPGRIHHNSCKGLLDRLSLPQQMMIRGKKSRQILMSDSTNCNGHLVFDCDRML
jgi:hypothetical protein